MQDHAARRAWIKGGTGSVAQYALELGRALDEIERLREALQEVVDHCRNTGHGSPLVDERIVERCEETAVLALKR